MKLSEIGIIISKNDVAPVRERGLKYLQVQALFLGRKSRSREGAWIEIRTTSRLQNRIKRRSREGAWIEILKDYDR